MNNYLTQNEKRDVVKVFDNNEFGEIRVIEYEGEEWLFAKDVAEIMDYRDGYTMCRMLDDDEKTTTRLKCTDSNYSRDITLINESGLFHASLKSTKPQAKRFRKWVTVEVLPSIRKSGGYIIEKVDESPEELMARALKVANETIEREKRKRRKIEVENKLLKPKAEFYDTVANSKDAIEMSKVSKIIEFPGYGRNNLFKFLRNKGVLRNNNIPYQKYIERGYFNVIEKPYMKKCNSVGLYLKTMVRQKGIEFIRNLLYEQIQVMN